jgi:glutamine synthetase
LLKPGKTPHQNCGSSFSAAALRTYNKRGTVAARYCVIRNEASSLGANEAPPAIISAFMGDMLTRVIDDIAPPQDRSQNVRSGDESTRHRPTSLKSQKTTRIEIARRRFALPGAKFDSARGRFRVDRVFRHDLNAAGRRSHRRDHRRVARRAEEDKERRQCVLRSSQLGSQKSAKVRFEGNNYSMLWVREAKKRGLLNCVDARGLAQMMTKQSRELFANLGILSKEELEARYNVRVEAIHQGHADRVAHDRADRAIPRFCPSTRVPGDTREGRGAGEVGGNLGGGACRDGE